MPPAATIEHALQHRLRLKVPSKRGDRPFFDELIQRLSQQPEILDVVANPVTGSVLIRHHGSRDSVTSMMAQGSLIRLQAALETPPHSPRRHSATNSVSNKTLAVGLSGLGLVQLARGEVTGSASENFWNAYRAQTHLANPLLTGMLVALGFYQLANGQLLGSATALIFYALTAEKLSREATGQASRVDHQIALSPPERSEVGEGKAQ